MSLRCGQSAHKTKEEKKMKNHICSILQVFTSMCGLDSHSDDGHCFKIQVGKCCTGTRRGNGGRFQDVIL